MEAFRKLLDDIGEPAMLELCYTFMTLATVRPTEEQRALLEAKFAQDRRYEQLRAPICHECEVALTHDSLGCDEENCLQEQRAANSEAIQKIVNFFRPEPTEIVTSAPPKPPAPKPPKEAERFWPAARAKRFAAAVGAKGRLNHSEALDFLCKAYRLTREQLFNTHPLDYGKGKFWLSYRSLLGDSTYDQLSYRDC